MKLFNHRAISSSCSFQSVVFLSLKKLQHVDSGTNHKRGREQSSKKPQAWWLHVQKIFLMLITLQSWPGSDSQASDGKFGKISSSKQVRQALDCLPHREHTAAPWSWPLCLNMDKRHEELKPARRTELSSHHCSLSVKNSCHLHEVSLVKRNSKAWGSQSPGDTSKVSLLGEAPVKPITGAGNQTHVLLREIRRAESSYAGKWV